MESKAELLPYRLCAGIVLLNEQGLVWAGRRIPKDHDSGAILFWQMPQGGIDKGEDPAVAAIRELHEETGVQSVEILAESRDWLTYDLPEHLIGSALKGKYRGQKQKWFAMRFMGSESEINIDPQVGHEAEFDAWQWMRLRDLPQKTVPFKRAVYQQVIDEFQNLIE